MNNSLKIQNDGINIFATLKIKASIIGLRIVSSLILVEIFIIIWMIIQFNSDRDTGMIFPLLIIIVFFLGIPIKYLLWNKYGIEQVIINSKSLSYYYDYGFFKTRLKTILFHKLETGFEKVKTIDMEEYGNVLFYNYNEENNLPELIHKTTIILNTEQINNLETEIYNLFLNQYLDDRGFPPFSIN